MSIWEKLSDKSWATPGPGEITDRSRMPEAAATTGLGFLIAVLTSMFFLFVAGAINLSNPDHAVSWLLEMPFSHQFYGLDQRSGVLFFAYLSSVTRHCKEAVISLFLFGVPFEYGFARQAS